MWEDENNLEMIRRKKSKRSSIVRGLSVRIVVSHKLFLFPTCLFLSRRSRQCLCGGLNVSKPVMWRGILRLRYRVLNQKFPDVSILEFPFASMDLNFFSNWKKKRRIQPVVLPLVFTVPRYWFRFHIYCTY